MNAENGIQSNFIICGMFTQQTNHCLKFVNKQVIIIGLVL